MTTQTLQKKALQLGLPKKLTDLSIFFGRGKQYLSNIKTDTNQVPSYIIKHIELLEQNQALQIALSDCTPPDGSTTYRVAGHYKGDPFTHFITSDLQSDLKQFGVEVAEQELPTEQKLYKKALNSTVVSYQFDYSSIANLVLTRIETKEEREELNKVLLFL